MPRNHTQSHALPNAIFVLHWPGRSVSMTICVSNLKKRLVNRFAA